MAQGPDGKTIIIVKKVSGHGGHHGGAWKVAYADFVTAMMCLFLVLWLVNSATVVTRERVASYFKRPGIFDEGSGTPLSTGGAGILSDAFAPPTDGNSQTIPAQQIYNLEADKGVKSEGFAGGQAKDSKQATEAGEFVHHGSAQKRQDENMASELKHELETQQLGKVSSDLKRELEAQKRAVASLLGTVSVQLDQRGLHLEIMDTPTASMFKPGSNSIEPEAEKELQKLAQILVQLPNPVDIEGHTDATPYRAASSIRYDNWNLSVDRANAARRVLQTAGAKDWQVARVVGYAAQRPKISEDPFAPANRRISFSMRYTDDAAGRLKALSSAVLETNTKKGKTSVTPLTAQAAALLEKPKPAPIPEPPKVVETPKPIEAPAAPAGAPLAATPSAVPPVTEKLSERLSGETISAESRSSKSGLNYELKTTLPEGTLLNSQDSDSEESSRPVWIEKDKIFGEKNPFLE